MIQIVNRQRSRANAPLKRRKFARRACAVTVGKSVYNFVCNSAFADYDLPIVPRGTFAEKKVKKPSCAFLRNMIQYTQLQKKKDFKV